jgi:hypothetical protein
MYLADNSPEKKILNSARFKRLTYSFYTYWACFALLILLWNSPEEYSDRFAPLTLLFWAAISLTYLITLSSLVAESRKSVFLWILGVIAFPFFGHLISYINIKTVAIQNGWT